MWDRNRGDARVGNQYFSWPRPFRNEAMILGKPGFRAHYSLSFINDGRASDKPSRDHHNHLN
ncbi:MAG: hypothetical protein JJU13_14100 [Balneolaceae bacterium]|nr:hypothetical protein [Balneolaceae bacterium]